MGAGGAACGAAVFYGVPCLVWRPLLDKPLLNPTHQTRRRRLISFSLIELPSIATLAPTGRYRTDFSQNQKKFSDNQALRLWA
ncbi:MAG: hypothetical protein R3D62_11790 [Xanthobacteraceae bacterium]